MDPTLSEILSNVLDLVLHDVLLPGFYLQGACAGAFLCLPLERIYLELILIIGAQPLDQPGHLRYVFAVERKFTLV